MLDPKGKTAFQKLLHNKAVEYRYNFGVYNKKEDKTDESFHANSFINSALPQRFYTPYEGNVFSGSFEDHCYPITKEDRYSLWGRDAALGLAFGVTKIVAGSSKLALTVIDPVVNGIVVPLFRTLGGESTREEQAEKFTEKLSANRFEARIKKAPTLIMAGVADLFSVARLITTPVERAWGVSPSEKEHHENLFRISAKGANNPKEADLGEVEPVETATAKYSKKQDSTTKQSALGWIGEMLRMAVFSSKKKESKVVPHLGGEDPSESEVNSSVLTKKPGVERVQSSESLRGEEESSASPQVVLNQYSGYRYESPQISPRLQEEIAVNFGAGSEPITPRKEDGTSSREEVNPSPNPSSVSAESAEGSARSAEGSARSPQRPSRY